MLICAILIPRKYHINYWCWLISFSLIASFTLFANIYQIRNLAKTFEVYYIFFNFMVGVLIWRLTTSVDSNISDSKAGHIISDVFFVIFMLLAVLAIILQDAQSSIGSGRWQRSAMFIVCILILLGLLLRSLGSPQIYNNDTTLNYGISPV
eukprot:UN26029